MATALDRLMNMPRPLLAALACAGLWMSLVCRLSMAADPATPPGPSSAPPSTSTDRNELERQFQDAFKAGDWDAAQDALLRWIAIDGRNFVPYYNLACVLARQDKLPEAERMLESAVTRGFADRVKLTTDPDLEPLRRTETYRAIIEGWEKIVSAQVQNRLKVAHERYPLSKGYRHEQDEQARIAYVSAFDPALFDEAKAQIARLNQWWQTQVLPADEPWRSGKMPPAEPWVIVLLPTRDDYQDWAQAAYGDMWERIGGEYDHDQRRLIAMDLGSTLRHEYWHVLHWRHMERLGQRHPAWIMEGLCSLVEDVKEGPAGEMIPVPSWRTNMTKRAAKVGGLSPLEKLFALDPAKFLRQRPLAQYAQARSLFMFLADRGKLREWYTTYVKTYAEDRTGKAAFEIVFQKPLKDVDKDFRLWLKNLPDVAVEITPGMANLPFSVDSGTGEGVVVASIPGPRAGGIKARDVITALDGRPVRDLYDYARILSEFQPGATIDVAYKRAMGKADAVHATTKVLLIRQPGE